MGDIPAPPASVKKQAGPYLSLAQDLEKLARDRGDPSHERVAYFARYHAVHKVIKERELMETDPEVSSFVMNLMRNLELNKARLGISKDTEGEDQERVRSFALRLFKKAHDTDMAGEASMGTAKSFKRAAEGFEILDSMNAGTAKDKEMRLYARSKAIDIIRALRAGERPTPGKPSSAAAERAMEDDPAAGVPSESGGGGGGGGSGALPPPPAPAPSRSADLPPGPGGMGYSGGSSALPGFGGGGSSALPPPSHSSSSDLPGFPRGSSTASTGSSALPPMSSGFGGGIPASAPPAAPDFPMPPGGGGGGGGGGGAHLPPASSGFGGGYSGLGGFSPMDEAAKPSPPPASPYSTGGGSASGGGRPSPSMSDRYAPYGGSIDHPTTASAGKWPRDIVTATRKATAAISFLRVGDRSTGIRHLKEAIEALEAAM